MTTYGTGTFGATRTTFAGASISTSALLDVLQDDFTVAGTTKFNNLEGGTAGDTVTTGNSGGASGDAFDVIAVATGGAVTFDSTVVRPDSTRSLRVFGGTSAAGTFSTARWTVSGYSTAHLRFWMRTPATMNNDHYFAITPASGVGFLVSPTAGKVCIRRNDTVAILTTGAATLSATTWYHFDIVVTGGSGCTVTIRDTAGNLIDTVVYSGSVVGTSNFTSVYFGYTRSNSIDLYFDDIWYNPITLAPDPTRWPAQYTPPFAVAANGVLTLTSPGGQALYNSVQSAATWSAEGSYLMAKVVPATPAGSSQSQQTYMSVDLDDDNWVAIFRDGTTLYRAVSTTGVVVNTAIGTYNGTSMAWWRIRFAAGLWITGYAADGLAWTEQTGFTVDWAATTTMRATFMVGKWDTADPAAVATIDKINMVPIVAYSHPGGPITGTGSVAGGRGTKASTATATALTGTGSPAGGRGTKEATKTAPLAAATGITGSRDAVRVNTGAGGTAGVNVTTANSGGTSGDAWQYVNAETANLVQFADVGGERMYRLQGHVGATGLFTYLRWLINTYSSTYVATRWRWRCDDVTQSTQVISHAYSNTPGAVRYDDGVYVTMAAGKLSVRNAANGLVYSGGTSITTLAANTTYDLELRTTAGAMGWLIIRDASGALLESVQFIDTQPATYTVSYSYLGNLRTPTTAVVQHFGSVTQSLAPAALPSHTTNRPGPHQGTVTGTGSVTGRGMRSEEASGSFVGTGAITGRGTKASTATGTALTGSGGLAGGRGAKATTATGTPLTGAGAVAGGRGTTDRQHPAGPLVGTGSVVGAGQPGRVGIVELAGVGLVGGGTGTAHRDRYGTLATTATVTASGDAEHTGTAALATTATVAGAGGPGWSATGHVDTTGQVDGGTGTAGHGGTATITAGADIGAGAGGTGRYGAGELTALAVVTALAAQPAEEGGGHLDTTATIGGHGVAYHAGTGHLTGLAAVSDARAVAAHTGRGALAGTALIATTGEAVRHGQGTLDGGISRIHADGTSDRPGLVWLVTGADVDSGPGPAGTSDRSAVGARIEAGIGDITAGHGLPGMEGVGVLDAVAVVLAAAGEAGELLKFGEAHLVGVGALSARRQPPPGRPAGPGTYATATDRAVTTGVRDLLSVD